MNITQQAYSFLEKGAANARLDTLKKFCLATNVELSFLVAVDVPVTEETVERYASTNYNEFLTNYNKLQQKLEIFDELLKGKIDTSRTHQIGNLDINARRT